MIINLGEIQQKGSKVFSGRENGKISRQKLNLDYLDTIDEEITVIIPDDTFSINTSFFLGLFGPSVRKLGVKGFKDKYKFVGNEIILKSLDEDIDRALKSSNVLKG